MRKKGIVSRVVAALITIAFMAAVRPDAEPARASIAFISILLYEGIRWAISYSQEVNRKEEHRQIVLMNREAMRVDGERLDNEVFCSIREVS